MFECLHVLHSVITIQRSKTIWIFLGHRNINLLSLDPLFIPKIDIQQGEESPVNIRLLFTNNSIYGVKDFNIYQIRYAERAFWHKCINATKLNVNTWCAVVFRRIRKGNTKYGTKDHVWN